MVDIKGTGIPGDPARNPWTERKGNFWSGNQFGGPGGVGNTLLDLASEAAGPILSLKESARFFSGARAVIRINGKLLLFANSISWSIGTEYSEIRVIDNYMPEELAPKFISVSGSIGGFKIPGKSVYRDNHQTNVLSFLFNRYIEIGCRDAATNEMVFFTKKAVITSKRETAHASQLATCNLDFKAIGWVEEVSPKYPSGTFIDSLTQTVYKGDNFILPDAPTSRKPFATQEVAL
jgi:hypothetical protein